MSEVKTYFENHKNIIEDELSKAKESVLIAVAWINFKEYNEIFENLLNRSIELKIVCSFNDSNNRYESWIDQLRSKGAEIRLLEMPNEINHMHHKFAIIDRSTILNGSFNWSDNAIRNFENIMVITNAKETSISFKREFDKLLRINTDTIFNLQQESNCSNEDCDGYLFNLLIFSESSDQYYQTYGDIVKVCNDCQDFETIQECIPNNNLEILLQEFHPNADDDRIDFIADCLHDTMIEYINDDIIIHAIGKVKTELDGYDNEWVQTNIIWKNNFVGNLIPNSFDNEDFNVLYDN